MSQPTHTHTANTSVEHSKKGVGKLLAIFIVPPLLVVLVILAFWIVPALQSNTEDGRQPTGGARLHEPTNR
jgi:hypothetical protein